MQTKRKILRKCISCARITRHPNEKCYHCYWNSKTKEQQQDEIILAHFRGRDVDPGPFATKKWNDWRLKQ